MLYVESVFYLYLCTLLYTLIAHVAPNTMASQPEFIQNNHNNHKKFSHPPHPPTQPAMEGRDLIARARTGSGKTLAFSLPIIEKILNNRAESGGMERGRRPQCLVLAPTRELASQVHREVASSAPTLEVGCYYGGSPYPPQERQLRGGVDIVVGTPGRIIDLIDRNVLDLSEVRVGKGAGMYACAAC